MSSSSSIALLAPIAAALLAAGCATTEPRMAAARAAPDSGSDATVVQNQAYVQRVEAMASSRGVGVVWVNPPGSRQYPRVVLVNQPPSRGR